MWKRLCGKNMPAKMLRTVVVTEMFDREAPEAVRKSMAIGMQHDPKTQEGAYRKSNQSTMVRPASNWLQERVAGQRSLVQVANATSGTSSQMLPNGPLDSNNRGGPRPQCCHGYG